MVVQADLWMERHLCENSTELRPYAIRDKLMGSMVTGAHRWLGQSLLGSRAHDYFVASGLFCTVVHSSLDARPDMAGFSVVLFARVSATFLGVAASLPMLIYK
jgi:hypothetical protein